MSNATLDFEDPKADDLTLKPDLYAASYRWDINVYRALAVLAVLLFHLDITGFSKGFLGVDLFFIISGYVITQSIERRSLTRFSVPAFFLSRVYRILPMVVVTVAITLVGGFFFLSPIDFVDLAKSALATILSLANIYFWATIDYFNPVSSTRPLLHMWSLGVEEQFYLFFPFLFIVFAKLRSRRVAIITLFFISMTLTTALAAAKLVDASTLFYLLPFRVGQFLAGASAYYLVNDLLGRKGSIIRVAAASASLLLAAVAFFIDIDDVFRLSLVLTFIIFPVFLINASPIAKTILLKPLHHIADWSFSIYVLHWPIIVYWKASGRELDLWGIIICAALTMGLSIATYELIENRFSARKKARGSWKDALKSIILPGAIVMLSSGGLIATNGLSFRLSEGLNRTYNEYAAQRTEYWNRYKTYSVDPTNFGERRISVAVLGDSFSVDIFNMIYRLPGVEAYSTGNVGLNCRALIIPKFKDKIGDCKLAEASLYLDYSKTDIIILSNHAASYAIHDQIDEDGFKTVVERLRGNGYTGRIALFGPRPIYKTAPYELAFSEGSLKDLNAIAAMQMSYSTQELDLLSLKMSAWSRENQVEYFAVHTTLCSKDVCSVINDDNEIVYFDGSHFSNGAKSILDQPINNFLRKRITPPITISVATAELSNLMADDEIKAQTNLLDLASTALLQKRSDLADRILDIYIDQNASSDIGLTIRTLWSSDKNIGDQDLAIRLSERLIEVRDDYSARYIAGLAYFIGEKVPANSERAIFYLDHPILANIDEINFQLYQLYNDPDNLVYNPTKAAEKLAIARELGYGPALKE